MNKKFFLAAHSVHLWRVFIPDLLSEVDKFMSLLDPEEMQRAQRLRFDEHRQRYIVARAILRQILSLYLHKPAQEIIFSYQLRGKPYLRDNPLDLQFNISHSHDMAVYAFTIGQPIGVDIEKIGNGYNPRIAQRFFSVTENEQLNSLPEKERMSAFYIIWAGKEALIKASGEGLFAPLGSFSVNSQRKTQMVTVKDISYYLESFSAHSDYQSAFATGQMTDSLVQWQWDKTGIKNILPPSSE